MELAIFFYLAGIVGNLGDTLQGIGLIGVLAFGLSAIMGLVHADTSYDSKAAMERLHKLVKRFTWFPIVSVMLIILSAFIPSKDTMYTMAAAYGVQTAAENPNVQRVAGKSLEVLESKLDEYLKVKDK